MIDDDIVAGLGVFSLCAAVIVLGTHFGGVLGTGIGLGIVGVFLIWLAR